MRGTYRADRHEINEPEANGEPVMPAWLDGDAAEFWQRVIPELVQMGLAKAVDADALAGMARWHSIWRAADAKLQAGSGDSYKLTIEATTAWKNFSALAGKFGLNPSDRTKIKADPPASSEPDPIAAILAEREKWRINDKTTATQTG
jgi:P27 family predicted phage terminase small subunit